MNPCPVCGNEERHERTGLLTCECPAPAPRLKIEPIRHFVRPDDRSANSRWLRAAVCGAWVQSRLSHATRDEVTCPRCLAWLQWHDELQP